MIFLIDSRRDGTMLCRALLLAWCCTAVTSAYAVNEQNIPSSTAKSDVVTSVNHTLQTAIESNDGRQISLWHQRNASFNIGASADVTPRWNESDREQAAEHERTWWFSGNYHF